MLARLRDLHERVRELRRATDSPAIERTMQLLDMYCHMARWELGDVDGMLPDAERPLGGVEG